MSLVLEASKGVKERAKEVMSCRCEMADTIWLQGACGRTIVYHHQFNNSEISKILTHGFVVL
jgi:hypothetical protein